MFPDDCVKDKAQNYWCGVDLECTADDKTVQHLDGCRPRSLFGTSAFLEQDLPWFPQMSDALLLAVLLILMLVSVMAALR